MTFVQIMKNRAYNEDLKFSPYEQMLGELAEGLQIFLINTA